MQFVVPQFIDIEPKIIGPLGVRQFIILIITGAAIFVAYKAADFALFLILAVIFFVIGGTLAFFKINGRPIHHFLLNVFQTAKKPAIRIWQKEIIKAKEISLKDKIKTPITTTPRKPLSTARLSQLSLLVDTGGAYREE